MPKQINEIKDFLLTARRKDAKCALPAASSIRGLRDHTALARTALSYARWCSIQRRGGAAASSMPGDCRGQT